MNHFHSGFADELLGMSKEAGKRRQAAKAALTSEQARALGRQAGVKARSGAKGALYGALFHKLVDPDVSTGQALRSGVGVTAGGHVGSAVAKGLVGKGIKGQLIGGLVGSALGLRMASRKKKTKKDERRERVKAMKKED